jgi:GTPase SAR1 family protein
MINVYFVGTAGSGKSTLVYAFQQWMTLQGLDTITVNLDPGAEQIPYEPDVDIRDWVKVEEVMRDYGLGPNGAQIVCADLMALNSKELVETVEKFRTNYVLIDTPGQIELFAFRQSSQVIIDALGRDQSFLAFLSDPALARTASGYVSMLMLCATVHFRFNIPFINLLSKSDTLDEKDLLRVLDWSQEPDALYDGLTQEQASSRSVLSNELFYALQNIGVYRELTPVSSEIPFGLEELYNIIQQSYEGGEDLSRD